MHNSTWNLNVKKIESVVFNFGDNLTATLDNAAAVDQGKNYTLDSSRGVNVVRIPATAHDIKANSFVYISGTTNYNGMHKVIAVAANTFDIVSDYTAETFAGTETAVAALYAGKDVKLLQLRVHASGDPGAGSLVSTLDSTNGADFDAVLDSTDMNGLTSKIINFTNAYLESDDGVIFTWANANSVDVGLELLYETVR